MDAECKLYAHHFNKSRSRGVRRLFPPVAVLFGWRLRAGRNGSCRPADFRSWRGETYRRLAPWFERRTGVKRILKPIAYLLAVVYFLVDAILLPVAELISRWIARRWVFDRLRDWVVSLRPYPTLFLFAVPVVVLEPIKPVALYWAGTGHLAAGVALFVAGELLKLVFVERLFSVSRDKLLSIPAFAWSYEKYRQVKDWILSSEAWQNTRRWSRIAQYVVRRVVRQWRTSPRRLSSQPR